MIVISLSSDGVAHISEPAWSDREHHHNAHALQAKLRLTFQGFGVRWPQVSFQTT